MKPGILILAAGGPAPGINTVTSTLSKVFLREGYHVYGLHNGYQYLFSEHPPLVDITFEIADRIFSVGGSFLRMSRYKPKDEEFNEHIFLKNNIKALFTIGGDDTASTANRVTKFLASRQVKIQNIHVPKTIDNDLPLPEGEPTFGYQSAKEEGVRIGRTIYEDARTTGNWFVISCMGRSAGHLAFGIGAACHYPMIVVPEMFVGKKITLEKVSRLIVSSIVKRRILGVPYGVAIVSEGVFHFIEGNELDAMDIRFSFDDHGHPELGSVSKSHIHNTHLQHMLKALQLQVKTRPVEMGYELRCIRPTAFDQLYCSLLSMGAKKLYNQGASGCIVTSQPNGDISPLYLKDVEDEQGKIKVRMLNMQGQKAKMVFEEGLQYLTAEDMKAAQAYLKNPEHYIYQNILTT